MIRLDIVQCWFFGCNIGNICWSIMFDAIVCRKTNTHPQPGYSQNHDKDECHETQKILIRMRCSGTELLSVYFPCNGMHSTRKCVLKYHGLDFAVPAVCCLQSLSFDSRTHQNTDLYWDLSESYVIFWWQRLEQLTGLLHLIIAK